MRSTSPDWPLGGFDVPPRTMPVWYVGGLASSFTPESPMWGSAGTNSGDPSSLL
jgi:hypothetical protein